MAERRESYVMMSEYALPATIYRVKEAEKSLAELKAEVNLLRTTLTSAIEQIQVGFVKKEGLGIGKTPDQELIVPDELRHSRGKRYIRDGKRLYGRKGRNAEQTAKRWQIWKAQCALGIPISVIARAWGCDHASILHAKRKGFTPYAKA